MQDILASRRIHTRGNPNPETLQSVENPERILRNRNKENVDFSLFGTSSSQDLYGITKPEWGVRAEKLRTKSKSESDMRKASVSSSIMQSYMLGSLWLNLKTPEKAEEIAPVFQKTQFPNP